MKNLIMIILFALTTSTMVAQEKKNKNAKVDIEVNGNCDQCKKRIEKAAYSVAGVKSAVWHQDDQTLHLILNEEKTTVLDVQKAVAAVGHDTNDVRADEETYNKLHHCCLYKRK